MKRPLLAPSRRCTGCMACADSCRFKALESETRSDGHLYPKWTEANCTQCGACTKACPDRNGYCHAPQGTSIPYAAWARDHELRMKSTSGGIFAALAVQMLARGGAVAGAVLEGNRVKHILIEEPADLPRLQGSKYLQGDLTGIYRQTAALLEAERPVLFSGTGCQIAGLYSFLGRRDYGERLVTADLVCGGFPSSLPMEVLLRDHPGAKIVSFRDKKTGWNDLKRTTTLTLDEDGKTYEDPWRGLFFATYLNHLTARRSCLDCRFTGIHRRSDLTLADFWGELEYPGEHFAGVSAVMSHSPSGEELLHAANIELRDTTWEKMLRGNFRGVIGRFSPWGTRTVFHRFTLWYLRRRLKAPHTKPYLVEGDKRPGWKAYHYIITVYLRLERLVFKGYRKRILQRYDET